jgi:hypothetical protein
VLIADSNLGVVWKLDIKTKKYEIAIKIPEAMDPVARSAALVGINGIHTHKGYLYWTNSNQVTLYRAKITEAGYLAPGAKAEVIVSTLDQIFMDDFTIDKRGTAWVCTNLGDTVLAVGQDGKEEIVWDLLRSLLLLVILLRDSDGHRGSLIRCMCRRLGDRRRRLMERLRKVRRWLLLIREVLESEGLNNVGERGW